VAAARCELAAAFLDDLRRIDAQIRETRKKVATAVQATGTSLIRLFGVGPVIAAAVIGDVRDVSRFGGRDHFAAYDGTAPIEVCSGPRKIYRLSRRGITLFIPGGLLVRAAARRLSPGWLAGPSRAGQGQAGGVGAATGRCRRSRSRR
jgi:transposase